MGVLVVILTLPTKFAFGPQPKFKIIFLISTLLNGGFFDLKINVFCCKCFVSFYIYEMLIHECPSKLELGLFCNWSFWVLMRMSLWQIKETQKCPNLKTIPFRSQKQLVEHFSTNFRYILCFAAIVFPTILSLTIRWIEEYSVKLWEFLIVCSIYY